MELTATLRSGQTVLAKWYDGKPSPKTYANRTQAERAAVKVGGQVYHDVRYRPFYVALDEKPTAAAHEPERICTKCGAPTIYKSGVCLYCQHRV